MFPITGDGALVLAVLFGALFGGLLHQGRVTDYNTIVNQFLLRDYTVAKVMLTAIVVGGVGIAVLVDLGAAKLAVRDANMLGTVVGAAIFGVGMAVYGYCPGTGLAATATGSLHAGAGVIGMVVGAIAYALSFGWVNAHILAVWKMGRVTLAQLADLPAMLLLFGLASLSLLLFIALETGWIAEKRAA